MNEHNQKHLTLSNRTYIEQELLQKSSFSSIGKNLHKDPSTIAKEVKRYTKTITAKYSYKCNLCKHYNDCDLKSHELKCPAMKRILDIVRITAKGVTEEILQIFVLILFHLPVIKSASHLMFVTFAKNISIVH